MNFIIKTIVIIICLIGQMYQLYSQYVFEEEIYDKNIHTVTLHLEEDPLSQPIIRLGSSDKILLSFDDFSENLEDYYYTIIHCNSDWKESDLITSEYIYGFYENRIDNYQFSFNTFKDYVHYELLFPQELMKPLLSGNYILKIFKKENNSNTVTFYKRFKVIDEKISISAIVKRSNIINERKYKQEIDFEINHANFLISNPYTDVTVVIQQNNREDNKITDLKPIFIDQDKIRYDLEEINTFEGGNEYRNFDTRSLRFYSERIKKIDYNDTIEEINVILKTDIGKSFEEYITKPDLNGEFLINKQEAWNSSIEADYINVYFSLKESRIIDSLEIYIVGKFTNGKILEKFKLKFNPKNRNYECNSLLKQGYYNYTYVTKNKKNNKTSTKIIDGNFFQTKNDYYIYVYFNEIGKDYQQLIGFIKTSSELF
tara:strand:- start:12682 stop:13965 length:1284 start_codon:yes stop_codon:yes gene_type:complete